MPKEELFLVAAVCAAVFAALCVTVILVKRSRKSGKKEKRRDAGEAPEPLRRSEARSPGVKREPGFREPVETDSGKQEPAIVETEHLYVYVPPASLRICRYCGSENPPGRAFCHCCGEELYY